MDPQRPRKLLLHKKEIRKLASMVQQQGMTIVPVSIYINDRGLAKLEIAAARGKKNYDKRDSIAKRDADMKMRRMKLR